MLFLFSSGFGASWLSPRLHQQQLWLEWRFSHPDGGVWGGFDLCDARYTDGQSNCEKETRVNTFLKSFTLTFSLKTCCQIFHL